MNELTSNGAMTSSYDTTGKSKHAVQRPAGNLDKTGAHVRLTKQRERERARENRQGEA